MSSLFLVFNSFFLLQSYWILVAAALSLHVLVTVTLVVARAASAERPRPSSSKCLFQAQDKGRNGEGEGSLAPAPSSRSIRGDLTEDEGGDGGRLSALVPLMSAAHLLSDEEGRAKEDATGGRKRATDDYSPAATPTPDATPPLPLPKQQEQEQEQERAKSSPLPSKDGEESVGPWASCLLELSCALRLLTITNVEK